MCGDLVLLKRAQKILEQRVSGGVEVALGSTLACFLWGVQCVNRARTLGVPHVNMNEGGGGVPTLCQLHHLPH